MPPRDVVIQVNEAVRGPAGGPGPPGPEGDSAYEVAVANGFVGTEAEWLESLESTVPGPPGPPGNVNVSDAAFGAGWNGVADTAPSQNAAYDELIKKANLEGGNTFNGNQTFNGTPFFNNADIQIGRAVGAATDTQIWFNNTNFYNIWTFRRFDVAGNPIATQGSLVVSDAGFHWGAASSVFRTVAGVVYGTLDPNGLVLAGKLEANYLDVVLTGTGVKGRIDVNAAGFIYDSDTHAFRKFDGTPLGTITATGFDLSAGMQFSVDGVPVGGGGGSTTYSVATRAALAASPTAANKVLWLAENRRAGMFKWNPADLSLLVAVDTQQGIYVPPTSDPDGSSGAWERQWSGPLDVQWFGAVPDNATDASPAIMGAISVSKALSHAGLFSNGGPAVYIPAGIYYCATTIDWNHTLHIFGDGCGDAGGDPTILRFPAGQTGLRLQYATTSGADVVDGVAHTQAAGSIIERLVLKGPYTTISLTPEGEFHGLHAKVRFTGRDMQIQNFQGNGFHIVADTGGGGATLGNANGWMLDKCVTYGCRNGLYIAGTDANAGMSIAMSVNHARRWGIWDRSFLGNTHITPHADGNGVADTTGVTPTMVHHSGRRFSVKQGQEAGAATNSPPASATDNTWWQYAYDGGEVAGVIPTWTNGITVRSGGSYGGDNANSAALFLGVYHEVGQGDPQIVNNMTYYGGNANWHNMPGWYGAGSHIRTTAKAEFLGAHVRLESPQLYYGDEVNYDADLLHQYSYLNGLDVRYYSTGPTYNGSFIGNSFFMGLAARTEGRFYIGTGPFSLAHIAGFDVDGIKTQAGKHIYTSDEAFAAGWNGSLKVPTQNAIFDRFGNVDNTSDANKPLAVAGVSPGYMSAADKTKLDGVASGATANSSDATLLARANHTGTQAISTVTGLQTALDGKAPATVTVNAKSTSFTAADADNNTHMVLSGASRTMTLNSTPATGVGFSARFTTAWTITCTSLSKNGAAPVSGGSVAAGKLVTFLHEGAGTWVASGEIT